MPSTDNAQRPNAVLVGGPHDGTELYVDGLPPILEDPTLPTSRTREHRGVDVDTRTWPTHVYKLDPTCLDPDGVPTTNHARYCWVRPAVAAV